MTIDQIRCVCCEQDTHYSLGNDLPEFDGWVCIWCQPCPHCGQSDSYCDPDDYWQNCPSAHY